MDDGTFLNASLRPWEIDRTCNRWQGSAAASERPRVHGVETALAALPCRRHVQIPTQQTHDAVRSVMENRRLPSRLIPHRHRPGAELQPAHELQVDMLR